MSKFKVGDWTIDSRQPKYTHKITEIRDGRYYYEVYVDGTFKTIQDWDIEDYETDEEVPMRLITPLDKIL